MLRETGFTLTSLHPTHIPVPAVRSTSTLHPAPSRQPLLPLCSSDGEEFIASGRDNLIHVFDAETMDPISILDGHACDVMFCRDSGDRQYAISGDSDGLVFV